MKTKNVIAFLLVFFVPIAASAQVPAADTDSAIADTDYAAADTDSQGSDTDTGKAAPALSQKRGQAVSLTAFRINREPTPDEIKALKEGVGQDLEILEKRTGDFRGVVDGMVNRIYRMRREFIDQSFERGIQAEEALDEKARADAIAYFERFLAKYPDNPVYTPDAMFRLAELYYDDDYRGKKTLAGSGQNRFKRTIDLLSKMITAFPDYRSVDAAFYVLGYCLNETGNLEEARLAFLGLVCSNKYKYDPAVLDERNAPGGPDEKTRPSATLDTGQEKETPERFVDPFEGCEPHVKNSRFFFESWWHIGNYHFDYDISRYGLETAIAAYKKLTQDSSHKFYDKGLYKLAWSYFKADMYPEAIDAFSKAVDFLDKQEGKKGTGIRPEAVQYLAVCFFTEDWNMDSQPDEITGVERVQDPKLMPQDRPWTSEVYNRLGDIYYDNEKNEEAIAVWKSALEKWPLNDEAPFVQEKIALAYNKMRRFDDEIAERGKIGKYGPGSEWWAAHADDLAVQNDVARMVRNAMLEAAFFHHESAQKLRQRGLAARDVDLMEQAVEEYNLAAGAYRKFLDQNPDTPDAYDIDFNLADALFWSGQYEPAKVEYVNVRDSNLDDKYREISAEQVIFCIEETMKKRIADGSLVLRDQPPEVTGDPLAPASLPMPDLLLELIKEREKFIAEQPKHKNAATYKYQNAQAYYRYGGWGEAKPRYEAIYEEYCTSDVVGIVSWKTLLNMATELKNVNEKERLALLQQKRSCGVAGEAGEKAGEEIRIDDVLGDVAMTRALEKFKICMEKKSADICDESGADLVAAVDRAPKHPSADAALHNAALAYENAQRFETAMQLYGRIVNDYPESKWVDKCLFKQAYAANRFFEYDKALDTYRIIADEPRFKESDYRADAVYNSAYILTNLQDYEKAVPYWQRYSEEVQEPDKKAEAAFFAADMYYRGKKWQRAIEGYDRFIKNFGQSKEAGPLAVKASYRAGLAQGNLQKKQQEAISWSRTAELYKRLVNDPGSISAAYAAESQFLIVEEEMRKFEKFSIQGSKKVIDQKIKEGAGKVKEFEKRYREVQEFGRPEWSLAAEFRIGYAYEVFAKALLKIPPPPLDPETQKALKKLPKEDREMVMIEYEDKFRAAMEQYVAGAESKAQAEYKVAVDIARKGNISNEWTLLALDRMNAYDPDNYPRQHDGVSPSAKEALSAPPWAPEVER